MKKLWTTLIATVAFMLSFAQIPTMGLIAYYPMGIPYSNVSPLTSHLDASGNGYHLTVSGGFGHGQGRTGTTGEAAEFNASNTDSRKYNYNFAQTAFQQTGDFTVSAWVRLGSPFSNSYNSIVQVGDNDIYLRFYTDASNNYFIQGGYRTGATTFANNTKLITVNDFFNTWRLITIRKSGASLQLFEGSTSINTVTNASPVVYSAGDKDFKVGNSNAASTCFKGRIQDVFYYSRAITTTELGQLACSATPPTNTTTGPYQNICPGTTVLLQAQILPNTNPINWYTAPVGGTAYWTGTTLGLGAVNSSATYYMDATASNGCVSYARVPIAVTVVPAASAPTNTTSTANQTVCSGNTTSLTATGSSVTWYAGPSGGSSLGSGNSFTTPAITGNTTFYAQDGTGNCASPRTAIAVTLAPSTPPAAPTNTTPTANLTRCGGQTASLSVNGSGTIEWFNVPSGGNVLGTGTTFTTPVLVNSTTPGTTTTVTYYAQSNSGCGVSARTPIAITVKYQYTITNITPTANLSVCNGSTTTLTISTDAPNIEWAENNGGINGPVLSTSATYTTPPMSSGAFYLPIASGNSALTCQAGVFITVNVLAAPAAPFDVTGSSVFCFGNTVPLDVVGSGTINWYDVPTGGTSLGTGGSFTTPILFSNATYYAQATVGNCTSVRTAIALTISTASPTNTTPATALTICSGSSTTLSAAGSGTLLWFDVPTGGVTLGVTPNLSTGPLTANKTYYVQNSLNGCASARVPITVTVIAIPTATISPATAAICNGASATLTASGGTSYAWSNSGGSNVAATFSPTINTTYTVTVSNATNCSATASRLVTVNALPNAAISPATVVICSGASATLTASGGSTYAWSNSGGSNAAATFSPTTNSTYTVTVTNAANCSTTASKLVTVNATPTAAISPATSTVCAGTSTTLNASGGGNYNWSTGDVGQIKTFSPAQTTTYTVTVTATPSGCTASASATINVNPTPVINSITATADTICAGATTSITATTTPVSGTSFNYLWSNGGQFPTNPVSPPTTSTYTVTVTASPSGCSATASKSIVVKATPTAAITAPDSICPGATTTLTATGGGSYLWSTNGATANISVAPTANTTYNVTVTATNGCTATAAKTIRTHAAVSAGITQDPNNAACPGIPFLLTVNATNPVGSVYLWSTGATGTSTNNITVTPPITSTYWVKVTSPKGCIDSVSKTVTVISATASISGPTSVCPGSSVTLTASGGGTYIWSNGLGQGAVKTVSPTTATTYTVTVSVNGCNVTASQTVSVQSAPTAVINGASSVCAGSSVTLTANGGNTYTWANGLGSNAAITVSPMQTTTYTVTASLGAGCTATATKTVTIKQPTSGSTAQTICFGDSVIFNGITRKQSGAFLDTLTNLAGCDSFLTLNLTVSQQITGNISRTVCFGESFVFNGQTLTQNGNYRDTLTAANGCDSILTLNFTVRPRIASIQSQSICNGSSFVFNGQTITQAGQYLDTLMSVAGCDSFITLNVSLGQSSASTKADTICNGTSYTFGTQALTQGGTYTRTIPNVAGCDSVITLNLFVRPAVSVAITKTSNVLSATAGFATYQWKLNGTNIPSANAQTYTATANGNYTVQVTDANGCSATSAITNVTGVGIDDITEIAVSIYPSPASDKLNITTTEVIKSLEISDMVGRKVLSSDHVNELVDISSLSSARYIISLKTAKGTKHISFVKE